MVSFQFHSFARYAQYFQGCLRDGPRQLPWACSHTESGGTSTLYMSIAVGHQVLLDFEVPRERYPRINPLQRHG